MILNHSAFFISLSLTLFFFSNSFSQNKESKIFPEYHQAFTGIENKAMTSKALDMIFLPKPELEKKLYLSSASDTIKKKPGKPVFVMKKSPWKAVLYSALLPGAGQFYNESYWKIPVIVGLGSYFVYGWIKNNNQYLDYKQQYANSQTPENPNGNLQLENLREFYRDQRDNFIIYSSILYLINLIDAYVDAQLFDFNVSDKVKFGLIQKDKLIKLSYSF